jgi:hypothetical protein
MSTLSGSWIARRDDDSIHARDAFAELFHLD